MSSTGGSGGGGDGASLAARLAALAARALTRWASLAGLAPFAAELTSYGGLELVRRYLHRLDVMARLRRAVATVPSDYGGARLALLVVALFYVGARRLEHLRYLAGDPLIARFCGVARLPTAHTVSNWLKQFTQATLAPSPTGSDHLRPRLSSPPPAEARSSTSGS
jgi:hypothetical protein